MRSPFPGIDLFLEARWGDVHTSLMVYLRDQIDEQLPGGLQARVEESIAIDMEDETCRAYPDIKVGEISNKESQRPQSTGTMILDEPIAEPILIPVPDELPTLRNIVIVDRNSGERIVTAIEVLSPTNKQDAFGRKAYQRKQSEYIAGGLIWSKSISFEQEGILWPRPRKHYQRSAAVRM